MNPSRQVIASIWAAAACVAASGSALSGEEMKVTVDNFTRAESDTYFAKFVKDGTLGKFSHERELAAVDKQSVIRMNRDTLYSHGVFDLDAGPVTLSVPDGGKRFIAVQIISEDHFTPDVIYTPGQHVLTKEKIGTRYVMALVRTFVNPSDPADVKEVHSLQDRLTADQAGEGKFEIPDWEPTTLKRVRDAINGLAAANGGMDSARMFGRKDQVDPIQHLMGTASGWGGNPRADATYLGGMPAKPDGKTVYKLTVKDVPVDGFWSISIYNKEGFFEENAAGAYTLNNVTAKPGADGAVTIQFGGCNGKSPNCLPVPEGWNYLFRMYRPRTEILDGTWKLPELEEVK